MDGYLNEWICGWMNGHVTRDMYAMNWKHVQESTSQCMEFHG